MQNPLTLVIIRRWEENTFLNLAPYSIWFFSDQTQNVWELTKLVFHVESFFQNKIKINKTFSYAIKQYFENKVNQKYKILRLKFCVYKNTKSYFILLLLLFFFYGAATCIMCWSQAVLNVIGVNAKWHSCYGKQYDDSSKN